MRTLHGYLLREVLLTLLMTVAVFTFVLLLGNALKEVLALLVNRQVTLWAVVQALVLLIPFVLVFALPMGMLTATLLVFGRFSADNELTAARAGGISLVALATPVLLLAAGLSGLCALINLEVAPQCRMAYKELLSSMGAARADALLPEKTFIRDFPGHIVYAGDVDGTELKDILIYEIEEGRVVRYLRAAEGALRLDRSRNVLHVELRQVWRVGWSEKKLVPESIFAERQELTYTNLVEETQSKLKINDMTFNQLRAELAELEASVHSFEPPPDVPREDLHLVIEQLQTSLDELTIPVKVQIHRQVAFSFACIGFTLVGIPLGIRAHRRETTFGIAVALVLVLLYYSFFILGHILETRPGWFPHLILWVPNFLFQAIGMVLLWRANRGV